MVRAECGYDRCEGWWIIQPCSPNNIAHSPAVSCLSANELINTYELPTADTWEDQSWRDPWLFRHPQTGDFHAFITARVKDGPPDGRGVIAHARSDDLVRWAVLPPVCPAGEFGKMEVPQLVTINGRYYLLFCTLVHTTSVARPQRTGRPPVTGTHYLVADNPLGPFNFSTDEFLAGDELGSLFAGKLVEQANGDWVFIAWRFTSPEGQFIGELSDPYPVTVDGTGNLAVDLQSWSGRLQSKQIA
jgi:beta-fructofuranosidase